LEGGKSFGGEKLYLSDVYFDEPYFSSNSFILIGKDIWRENTMTMMFPDCQLLPAAGISNPARAGENHNNEHVVEAFLSISFVLGLL